MHSKSRSLAQPVILVSAVSFSVVSLGTAVNNGSGAFFIVPLS